MEMTKQSGIPVQHPCGKCEGMNLLAFEVTNGGKNHGRFFVRCANGPKGKACIEHGGYFAWYDAVRGKVLDDRSSKKRKAFFDANTYRQTKPNEPGQPENQEVVPLAELRPRRQSPVVEGFRSALVEFRQQQQQQCQRNEIRAKIRQIAQIAADLDAIFARFDAKEEQNDNDCSPTQALAEADFTLFRN